MPNFNLINFEIGILIKRATGTSWQDFLFKLKYAWLLYRRSALSLSKDLSEQSWEAAPSTLSSHLYWVGRPMSARPLTIPDSGHIHCILEFNWADFVSFLFNSLRPSCYTSRSSQTSPYAMHYCNKNDLTVFKFSLTSRN